MSENIDTKKFSGVSNALLNGIADSLDDDLFKAINMKFIGICISPSDEGLLINVGGNVNQKEAPRFLRKTADEIEEREGNAPSVEDLMVALREVLSDEIEKLNGKEEVKK